MTRRERSKAEETVIVMSVFLALAEEFRKIPNELLRSRSLSLKSVHYALV